MSAGLLWELTSDWRKATSSVVRPLQTPHYGSVYPPNGGYIIKPAADRLAYTTETEVSSGFSSNHPISYTGW